MVAQPVAVGSSELARAFFAGRYEDVLSASIDSSLAGPPAPEDLAFVVGALAFVGRMPEATLLLKTARDPSARTKAASTLFLVIAHCRAAELDQARARLRLTLTETGGSRDSWCRAMLAQAAACCHYFSAEHARAERAALIALRSSLAAAFPYGQLLANDMRGHLLLRRGHLLEALSVLEQARRQAEKLDFSSNAHAIEIALRIGRAAMQPWQASVEALRHLLDEERSQDAYSRRVILTELVHRLAYAGQCTEARRRLDEGADQFTADARSRAQLALLRAHIARASRRWDEVDAALARAESLLPGGLEGPPAADLLGLRAALARAGKQDAMPFISRLRTLSQDGLYRAEIWRLQLGDEDASAADGDASSAALAQCAEGAHAALDADLLGLVPELLGLEHGRWIVAMGDTLLLCEDGDVTQHSALSPRLYDLLEAIAAGGKTKEELLEAVWGIRKYRPERHDSVIKTAVSRLRSELGPCRGWIRTSDGTYQLASGVSLRTAHTSFTASDVPEIVDAELSPRRQRILEQITRGERSVAPLARRLGMAPRTVSRELGQLCELGLLERIGRGPATHYRLRNRP